MKSLIYSIVRLYHSIPAKAKVAHRGFLVWRHKHLNNRQFVMILSILIGFSAGLVAVVLKNADDAIVGHCSILELVWYIYQVTTYNYQTQ